ncbi:hypothetical protein [Burkholderia ubonensis]|uniref:hypothetical protein n=1 Tax=Burkholderia ubonensis TaxID=101571 RepID=UPI00075AADAC|nr:hypothetical protein [Burkholderia ubonensis]KWF13591.1 hypothetical protein WL83_17595 [Burkholderia ubonensis]
MNRYTKVKVVCPGGAMTAGPEALHQLVAELNRLGQPAAIVYSPFDRAFETPEPYRKYAVPVEAYADERGELIVFPEIMPTNALRVKRADAAIWWMSLNNYTCLRYGNPLRDRFRYFKAWIKGKRPLGGIGALRHLKHFAQSHHAQTYLAARGFSVLPLTDSIPVYTAPDYLAALPQRLAAARHDDVILYNPSKGRPVTERLMRAYPQWQFKPLRGLNREQLADAFCAAKVYIDFGHHPGRDRLPREAAVHGCCVVTARHGSAGNPVDVPIPDKYKLEPKASGFVEQFGHVIDAIFGDFERCSAEFEPYRQMIHREADVFDAQIRRAFELGGPSAL